MDGKAPVWIFAGITILLIVIFILLGILIRDNFIGEKKVEEKAEVSMPENVAQSRAIISTGILVFLSFALMYMLLKVFGRKNRY